MSSVRLDAFAAALEAQREVLIAGISRETAAEIEAVALWSEEERRALAEAVVEVVLRAIRDPQHEPLDWWAQSRQRVQAKQGITLAHTLQGLAIVRRHLLRSAREAVEARAAGAWEGLEAISRVIDELLASFIARFYEDLAAAHEALKQSEERYRGHYLRTPAMLHSIDMSGKLIAVSDRWLEALGYTREEVLGRRTVEFMTEESRRRAVESVFPEFLRKGTNAESPFQLIKKNGEIMDVRLSAVLERDGAGQATNSLTVLVDVTEQLSVQRALRDTEARYRSLVELSPVPIGVHRDSTMIYANIALARLLGAKGPEQLMGRRTFDFVHPDSLRAVRERLHQVEGDTEPERTIEERWVRLDGDTVDVEVAARQIPYEGTLAIQVIAMNVTERKRADEALRRSAAQEELLRVQEQMVRALSTPLIPVSERVVVMPLVGRIDACRAGRILEVLLAGVTEHRAAVAILDITGVPEVDAGVADALVGAARAVRLLGTEAVLTGIQPAMAQALVRLDVDLAGIVTHATLASAIARALRR